jgi:hypothetical protein
MLDNELLGILIIWLALAFVIGCVLNYRKWDK